MPRSRSSKNNSTANLGWEVSPWLASDAFYFGISTFEFQSAFRRDLHPDLRADYLLANPPFNDSDWFRKDPASI